MKNCFFWTVQSRNLKLGFSFSTVRTASIFARPCTHSKSSPIKEYYWARLDLYRSPYLSLEINKKLLLGDFYGQISHFLDCTQQKPEFMFQFQHSPDCINVCQTIYALQMQPNKKIWGQLGLYISPYLRMKKY